MIKPVYTKEELTKLIVKEKKFYMTHVNAHKLKIPINKDWKKIGALREYETHSGLREGIYEITGLTEWVEEEPGKENPYYIYENQLKFNRKNKLKEHFVFVGYYFDKKDCHFHKIYSIEEYMAKKGISMIPENDKHIISAQHLGPLMQRKRQLKKVGDRFKGYFSFTLEPAYDIEGYCEKKGIKLYNEKEKLTYPLFHEKDLKSMKKEFYISQEVGLVIEDEQKVKGIYNLEQLCKTANLPIISLKEYEKNEYFKYLTQGKSGHFPKKWGIKKDLICVAFREDGSEILGFPNGMLAYFSVSTPTVSDLVVPCKNLQKFIQKIRKEGLSIDDMSPRAVTEKGEFVFDTRGNKEWAQFRVRYLLNPIS